MPVVYDATHSVQMPGGQGSTSGGQREMVPVLAELLWQRVLMGCLWSAIPILPRQSPMARTPGLALVGQPLQQLQAIDASESVSRIEIVSVNNPKPERRTQFMNAKIADVFAWKF